MLSEAYKTSVLKPEVHSRLVSDLVGIARDANIPKEFIWTPLVQWVSETEIDYVRDFRRHAAQGIHGFVYTGLPTDKDIAVSERMFSLAGAFIRNFIAARVISLGDLLSDLKADDPPMQTVVLVPNFYTRDKMTLRRGKTGSPVSEWQLPALLGWLYDRMAMPTAQTILYVQDWDGMAEDYGEALTHHLTRHFYRHTF
jgi:hypothetical protein